MTSVLDRPASLIETIPAFRVAVDLTPREIVVGRRAKITQRLVLFALVVVLLAVGGLAFLSYDDRRAAQDSYDAAEGRTTALAAAAHQYDDIVTITTVRDQTAVAAAQLLGRDVNMVKLMARIRAVLPTGVTITNLSVILTPEQAAAATSPDDAAAAGTDTGTDGSGATSGTTPGTTTGGLPIGTISVSGNGTRIKALAPFVAALNHTPGLVDVVPTSTVKTDTGMTYTLTLSFTDLLYTHRFDQTTGQATGEATGSTDTTEQGAAQ